MRSATLRFLGASSVVAPLMLASHSALAQDPTAMGPFTVLTAEYNRGDNAFSCLPDPECGVPSSEIRAEVYYPSDLGAGPFPLLVFLHGRHSTCYNPESGTSTTTWPCPTGFLPIPSYRGYDYIGKVLASHGYIVASLSANGINAQDFLSPSLGIDDRAHLIEEHLTIWNDFNTVGSTQEGAPFAGDFIGAVDLDRVGTMGHSRGGDGVVKHFALFGDSSPFNVRAVLPIAPTNFSGEVINNVDLGVLLSYCDGDVFTLEGSLFYDRARYLVAGDESSKYTFLSLGSNHNYFNTAWTPDCWLNPGSCWSDDRGTIPTPATGDDYLAVFSPFPANDPFCGPDQTGTGRLTSAEQRGVGLAYTAAFFRHHIGGESAFGALLRGDSAPPATVDPNVFVGYHPPASLRVDLNRLNDASELSQTTLTGNGGVRGAVTNNGLEVYERCGFEQSTPCFPGATREVHLSNFAFSDPGLSRLRTSWNAATDSFVNELPEGARQLSAFDVLQFRVGVDYTDADNPISSPVEFSVTLDDGTSTASVNTSSQVGNDVLFFPPGEGNVPTTVMSTLRLPLSAFGGVNLSNVQSVTIQYDATPAGTILLSDIAFAMDASAAAGPGCQASESFLVGDRADVLSADSGPAVHNSGTGQTRVGNDATTDGILSVAAVQVLDRATVNGNITSAGTVTVSPTAAVAGAVTPFGTVSLPPLPSLPDFPAPSGGNIFVNPGAPLVLAPGSYPSLFVNSGGNLRLSAGDYFFVNLSLNSAAMVEVAPGTRVFVQNTLTYSSPFVAIGGGGGEPIFLGFAGANLFLNAPFEGTLVAPSAHVRLGTGSGLTYSGSFFARILEVMADSTLICVPGSGGPDLPTCSDGVLNGDETDVDCGGPDCADCSEGSTCEQNDDCASGICSGGICQPPAGGVSAAFQVTADWGGGYCVALLVTNTASSPTTDWNVLLNTNQSTIYTSWNGTFSGPSGSISVEPGFSWNMVIPSGATNNSVGFCANRAVPGSGTLPFVQSSSGSF